MRQTPPLEIEVEANGIIGYAGHGRRTTIKPVAPAQVRLCRDFLAQCERTKTGRVNSYWLKHVVENAVGVYVSNGSCIKAALDLGLVVEPLPFGPNARIGVSHRSVRAVAGAAAMEAV